MTHKDLIHNLKDIVDYVEGESTLHKSAVIEIIAKLGDEIVVTKNKLKSSNMRIKELINKGAH